MKIKISPDLFEAFLKCPTKCWLRATNEPGSGNDYSEWVKSQTASYRATETGRLLSEIPKDESAVSPTPANLKTDKWRLAMDVLAQTPEPANDQAQPDWIAESCLHAVERVPSEGRGRPAQFIPIRFIFTNKLSKDDKMLVAFDAFVFSEMAGRAINLGKIIHGDDHATLKVKVASPAGEVRKRIEKMAALLSSPSPPDLVLNRHCVECEFQARCRRKAIETDDLSLLAGMSAKERQKLRSKGIFTVTQLSYTFRPRRRPKRMRDKREKYHHSLKALAIREKKIHIVGSPELKIEGTPVYLDVEGLPDRDFYYLIGLRIGNGDSAIQHSLWADTVADERKIWREFLAILGTVEKPVLIHYGSYETTFLKRMNERYGDVKETSSASKSIHSTLNLLSFIFGRIYLPIHSNGLKEMAAFVGARRNSTMTAGIQTIALRQQWEITGNAAARNNLLTYNRDDCAALNVLMAQVLNVIANPESRADVDFANAPKNLGTVRATEIYQTFNAVLKSAHSDYSKSRIKLVGTGVPMRDTISEKSQSRPKKRRLPAVKGYVIRVSRKRKCERHRDHPTLLVSTRKWAERSLIDIAFSTTGCRKSVFRLIGKRGRCPYCGEKYVPPAFKLLKSQVYGPGFIVWVVYLRMVLRLSYRLITQATRDFFGVDVSREGLGHFVKRCAEAHVQTEKLLQDRILQSPAIHIDETKLSILGSHHYVWVLTDGRHVIFRLTESRETGFLNSLLADFSGVLVSDFYGGYDALPCLQQKCLVHLIRDLNDDLWKNPFDAEIEAFVASVRDLLLPILTDAQRFGLKTFHLRKHQHRVNAFYRDVIDNCTASQEIIVKYRKRFERYRESLFTFLDRDGVPWNNNAAERALRHLAVQRKISGAFSNEGAQDYIRLLGVAQSCRFQEKSFLAFLRSGLSDVDAYYETGSRRKRSAPADDSNADSRRRRKIKPF
jgi:predicted RecB family nuclease